ncbi:MAG TPA: P-type conjugative transfer protein TrbG [Terriglobia bacterium]|nr:P-type conjugative transfer protein TrbG [Terriglobia bacterium]
MRMIRRSVLLSLSLLLASCADKAPPPAITYDAAALKPAKLESSLPKPVEIVTVAQPLPLPGQLQPFPDASQTKDTRLPTERVEAANAAALQEPTAHGYLNAIQVFPFTDGALYRLYAAPEQVTDIALQAGEGLIAVSAGDTVRWVVGDTTSGSGASKQVHVLVKPVAPDLKTNLVIMTDRRSYHLALESTEHTSMAAISWVYPRDDLIALQAQNKEAQVAEPVASGLALENLRFRYEITGDSPPWRPLRAFDDGAKVYIEFPERIDQGEAPPLFVVGPTGGNELVNYRMRQNYYIIDRLFAAAELRLGEAPQQVVRISRTDTSSTKKSDLPIVPTVRPGR